MKGVTFCEHQLGLWQGFSGRADGYVASVRRQADELAIQGAIALRMGREVHA